MARQSSSKAESEPRRRILDAAALVFAERGFDGAGVDEIAARAGVNKAMLYYHVGDKATLYGAVTTEFICRIRAEIERRLAGLDDPLARLRTVQRTFLDVMYAHPHYPQLMQRELADGGTHLPSEALASMAEVMRITRSILADGHRAGVFRAVHPLLAHLLIVSSAMFIMNAQRLRSRLDAQGLLPADTPPDLLSIADALADVVLHGIAVEKKPGGKR
ncbi:MAG: TetR/AcrR family transcriptional regulator [Acidobacteria bacterium]|nr:TetR/AcrR family transcriptional regulator [Acidobacteriota bacterium]